MRIVQAPFYHVICQQWHSGWCCGKKRKTSQVTHSSTTSCPSLLLEVTAARWYCRSVHVTTVLPRGASCCTSPASARVSTKCWFPIACWIVLARGMYACVLEMTRGAADPCFCSSVLPGEQHITEDPALAKDTGMATVPELPRTMATRGPLSCWTTVGTLLSTVVKIVVPFCKAIGTSSVTHF